MKETFNYILKENSLTIDSLIRFSITTLEETSKTIASIRATSVEEIIYTILIDFIISGD